MNPRKLASIAGLAATVLVSATGVQGAVQRWSFEDDDVEAIYRASAGGFIQAGTLAVGDIFVAVFENGVFTINGANAIPAGQELTGVAAVQLNSISDIDPITPGIQVGVGSVYTFGAIGSNGLNAGMTIDSILALGSPNHTTCDSGGGPTGVALCMWLNGTSGAGGDRNLLLNRSSDPATNCATIADCIDQASRGTLLQSDGFKGDADEFWRAVQTAPGGNDIAGVLAANNNLLISSYNYALSTFFNTVTPVNGIVIATGADCGPYVVSGVANGCVQFSGSGTVTGGQGLTNGFIAHSDNDAQKLVAVPEPATLALMGIGLLGLGERLRLKA